MKKFLLLLIVILSSAATFGQTQHLIGISGGINVARMSGYANQGFLVAPVAGISYQFRFARILSIETGVLYDQRGGIGKVSYTDENAMIMRYLRVPHRHTYLSIPLKFGMVSRGEVYGFGNIGIMPSYMIKAVFNVPESTVSEEVKVDYTQSVHRVDVAVLVEGGIGVKVAQNLHITGAAGVQMGLLDVIKEEDYLYGEGPFVHHYGFSVVVGVRYAFGGGTDSE